jgi:membrane dipeptidase
MTIPPEPRVLVRLLLPVMLLFAIHACRHHPGAGKPEHEIQVALTDSAEMAGESPDPCRLSRELLLIDGHIDLPDVLQRSTQNPADTTTFNFDYPKARRGGLNAAFLAIYVPYRLKGEGARDHALNLVGLVRNMTTAHPQSFSLITRAGDLENHDPEGPVMLALGMENGSPLEGRIQNLQRFYDLGIRYITLVHSRNNEICDSATDPRPTWNGLSPFGVNLIAEMNRLGIMIDVSHVSDSTFYQVVRLSRSPVIASHSGCRALATNVERNMSDDMLEALRSNGGLVMINFGSYFLNADSHRAWTRIYAMAWGEGLGEEHPRVLAFMDSLSRTFDLYRSVGDVADHIDHVVRIAGIDHVGLGSDFDGVGKGLPHGLRSAADYPNLIAELLRRGYSRGDIAKIAGRNLLRVWRRNEELAVD